MQSSGNFILDEGCTLSKAAEYESNMSDKKEKPLNNRLNNSYYDSANSDRSESKEKQNS